jgi:hypothetical protein
MMIKMIPHSNDPVRRVTMPQMTRITATIHKRKFTCDLYPNASSPILAARIGAQALVTRST